MNQDPFDCPGPECHDGDFPEFDHFCDVLDVKDGEYGQAFAAWLGGTTGWDGAYGPVEEPPRHVCCGWCEHLIEET